MVRARGGGDVKLVFWIGLLFLMGYRVDVVSVQSVVFLFSSLTFSCM